jgi:hypothetical protein
MKRTFRFETELRIGLSEVVVNVEQAHVAAWALEVALFLEGFTESLTVHRALAAR